MKCKFCDTEASYTCAWKVYRSKAGTALDLYPGMVLSNGAGEEWRLVSLESSEQGTKYRAESVGEPGKVGEGFIPSSSRAFFRKERENCGAAVCERHVREVSEDRHYCSEHWDAWERKAEGSRRREEPDTARFYRRMEREIKRGVKHASAR